MNIQVGDLVQITESAVDLLSGKTPKPTDPYLEGSKVWGSVSSIVDNYKTKNYSGVVREVTKVAVANQTGEIEWQVEAKHIAANIIKKSNPKLLEDMQKVNRIASQAKSLIDDPSIGGGLALAESLGVDPKLLSGARELANIFGVDLGDTKSGQPADLLGNIFGDSGGTNEPYATTVISNTVDSGGPSSQTESTGELTAPIENVTKDIELDPFTKQEIFDYEKISFTPNLLGTDIEVADDISRHAIHTAMSDSEKRRMMLNEDIENIQNQHAFPAQIKPSNQLVPARYDYQIDLNDSRYPLVKNMEDELMKFRAAVGLPVHGNNDIARAMKYYMYNRFKSPDINLAHNKTFTHIFFTRPDLNILEFNGGANQQARSNTESAMIWKRHPDLFKLLTDHRRCRDSNNFNLLLSNQCISFDIKDENLSTIDVGRSWSGHEISYGDRYTGNGAGEITCTFMETSDFSVFNLIKLWITYIDNVSRGAWSPSYNLQGTGVSNQINMSHVYTRSLDYGASVYAIKTGPDGEDILYWSKYYGLFPITTGAGAFNWSLDGSPGDTPKLSITFKYSFKRDMSPISLLEFNKAANIIDVSDSLAEAAFNRDYGHSNRPYVGAPYIEMKLDDEIKGFPSMNSTSIGPNAPTASIRLKFQKDARNRVLRDETMYRNGLAKRSSNAANPENANTLSNTMKKISESSLGRTVGSFLKSALNRKKSTSNPSQQTQSGYGGYSF